MFLTFPDEENCNNSNFNCSIGSSKCIPWLWVCDGDEDCVDGRDEADATCGKLPIILFVASNLNKIHCRQLEVPRWGFQVLKWRYHMC